MPPHTEHWIKNSLGFYSQWCCPALSGKMQPHMCGTYNRAKAKQCMDCGYVRGPMPADDGPGLSPPLLAESEWIDS